MFDYITVFGPVAEKFTDIMFWK